MRLPARNEIDAIKIAGRRTIMRTASSCFRNKVYKHNYTIAPPSPSAIEIGLSFQTQLPTSCTCNDNNRRDFYMILNTSDGNGDRQRASPAISPLSTAPKRVNSSQVRNGTSHPLRPSALSLRALYTQGRGLTVAVAAADAAPLFSSSSWCRASPRSSCCPA